MSLKQKPASLHCADCRNYDDETYLAVRKSVRYKLSTKINGQRTAVEVKPNKLVCDLFEKKKVNQYANR